MMVGNVRELHESAFLDIWTMHQVKLDTLVCEIRFMNYINAITGALSLTVCEAPIDDCYHQTSKNPEPAGCQREPGKTNSFRDKAAFITRDTFHGDTNHHGWSGLRITLPRRP